MNTPLRIKIAQHCDLFDLIFAEFVIPPFHSTIPVHCSSPVIVDYLRLYVQLDDTLLSGQFFPASGTKQLFFEFTLKCSLIYALTLSLGVMRFGSAATRPFSCF